MKKALTKRQAIILFGCVCISLKLQRIPALMSDDFSRDMWIAMIALFAFDFLLLLLVLRCNSKLKGQSLYDVVEQKAGRVVLIIVCLLTILFFFTRAMISYKQLHEFFANTLFNKLPWWSFSILFLCLLVLMIGNGLNNIGRTAEFYSYIMLTSLIAIFLLGAFSGQYDRLLPILDINITKSLPLLFKYLPWFTDSILLLYFIGNIKEEKNMNKSFIITHIVCSTIVVVGAIIFYTINDNLSGYQNNALSSMAEYTLVGLGIGRPDWFLVLFANISGIITAALSLWIVAQSICRMCKIKLTYLVATGVCVLVYLWDWLVYQNLELGLILTKDYASYYIVGFSIILPVFVMLLCRKTRRCKSCEKNI